MYIADRLDIAGSIITFRNLMQYLIQSIQVTPFICGLCEFNYRLGLSNFSWSYRRFLFAPSRGGENEIEGHLYVLSNTIANLSTHRIGPDMKNCIICLSSRSPIKIKSPTFGNKIPIHTLQARNVNTSKFRNRATQDRRNWCDFLGPMLPVCGANI